MQWSQVWSLNQISTSYAKRKCMKFENAAQNTKLKFYRGNGAPRKNAPSMSTMQSVQSSSRGSVYLNQKSISLDETPVHESDVKSANSRSRCDVTRLSNKRSPYLFGVATANRTKVTTPNKYGAKIIARMSDWENITKIHLHRSTPIDLAWWHNDDARLVSHSNPI